MQACVDADVTKHLRKGRRSWWLCSSLPRCMSAAVNRAIQLAGDKKCCSGSFIRKSEKKETERKKADECIAPSQFPLFPPTPSTEMFTDSTPPTTTYIGTCVHACTHTAACTHKRTSQLGHVSKRRGLFICTLAARKFRSLMAFKTGSGRQLKNKERKKGRREKRGG